MLLEVEASVAAGIKFDPKNASGPITVAPLRPRNSGTFAQLAARAADSKGIRGDTKWRRRESNLPGE